VFALGLLVWRAARGRRRPALVGAGAALAVGLAPYLLWLVLSAFVFDRPWATNTAGLEDAAPNAGLRRQIGYVWQVYLPRLPFMDDQFIGFDPIRSIWFDGFVGRLGYSAYEFPSWFNDIALGLALVLVALAIAAFVRRRDAVRARVLELAAYAAAVVCILVVVGVAGFRLSPGGAPVLQARYLLPLLAVYAALVALAARAPGVRRGPAVAATVAVIAVVHNFAAVMLALGHYYS
jgi:hypothetical protein